MEGVFYDHFLILFSSGGAKQMDTVFDGIHRKVSDSMNMSLLEPYARSEVLNTLKQMHPMKAFAPNSVPPIFFQKSWHVIHRDVAQFVIDILNNHRSPGNMNYIYIYITLISKTRDPCTPSKFRTY